ncbi:MAG: hypothetical protein WHV60_10520 [Bacteroidota bacterium]
MKKSHILIVLFTYVFLYTKLYSECDTNALRTVTFYYFNNNIECKIQVDYCCDIVQGFHNFRILQIRIFPPCDSTIYENDKRGVTDKIIEKIAEHGQDKCWGRIPNCKDGELCIVRWEVEICYSRWVYKPEPDAHWEMVKCDIPTRCNETVRICWDGQKYIITRQGYVSPPCPNGCRDNCGY